MRRQNTFTGFLLIGLGAYFLLRQLHIPLLTDFYSWPTILMIIGISFLLHSYITNEFHNIFAGAVLLGFGIHFHGLTTYRFWLDHWGVYPLIIGSAFVLRSNKTKQGLVPGLLLVVLGLFALFSPVNPGWFHWVYQLFALIEQFWPLALVIIGLFLLKNKKNTKNKRNK
ncbi:hypothetical protein SAMN05421743_105163 [Thalassobacillus cyri]|uniref:LiaI-LiaF-like transmembrane region domain-containing protein n=1 Tax=Thalassobacillus cyri TaxID=571932 RepID=A0A1H4BVA0_9BACI|nr:DUF5668 domain-containing protein [Thalassobacillus cyri]SEA52105.1 hypothetical protein SAMN05421743_105163 [Thalassobacillus cyri]